MRMLLNNRTLRFVLFAAPALALAAAALFLAFGPGAGERAEADSPHAGLDFAFGVDFSGDGMNDCGTGAPAAVGDGAPDAVAADVSNATCAVPAAGTTLQVNVYLMSAGGIPYAGEAAQVFYDGLTSNGRGTTLWTCHTFDVTAPANPAYENAGSAIGISDPCNVGQTNLGLMNRFSFTCAANGTLRLGQNPGETGLSDDALLEHNPPAPEDTLTVNCGDVGGGTDTPVPPTSTPTGPTATTGPTNTPTNTATTGPTNTPTNTSTPVAKACGDVNDNGSVNAVDAQLVLQYGADLVSTLANLPSGDVNGSGDVTSVDAALILQAGAGLIPLGMLNCG